MSQQLSEHLLNYMRTTDDIYIPTDNANPEILLFKLHSNLSNLFKVGSQIKYVLVDGMKSSYQYTIHKSKPSIKIQHKAKHKDRQNEYCNQLLVEIQLDGKQYCKMSKIKGKYKDMQKYT